jgi:hypothetical protein
MRRRNAKLFAFNLVQQVLDEAEGAQKTADEPAEQYSEQQYRPGDVI